MPSTPRASTHPTSADGDDIEVVPAERRRTRRAAPGATLLVGGAIALALAGDRGGIALVARRSGSSPPAVQVAHRRTEHARRRRGRSPRRSPSKRSQPKKPADHVATVRASPPTHDHRPSRRRRLRPAAAATTPHAHDRRAAEAIRGVGADVDRAAHADDRRGTHGHARGHRAQPERRHVEPAAPVVVHAPARPQRDVPRDGAADPVGSVGERAVHDRRARASRRALHADRSKVY